MSLQTIIPFQLKQLVRKLFSTMVQRINCPAILHHNHQAQPGRLTLYAHTHMLSRQHKVLITMTFLPVWHTQIFFPLLGWLCSGGLAASVRCPGTCLLQICQCWLSQLQQLLGARCETVQNTLQSAKQAARVQHHSSDQASWT